MGLLDVDGLTRTGEESASLAFEDMPTCLEALVPILAQGVEGELRGRGGFDTLGLLREAAGKLAETTNLWARVIPGLLPIEIGAIVHWARVEPRLAIDLVDNLESWRDVPMHKEGGPPDPKVQMEVHVERHFECVYEFYLEYPWLAEQTPSSFAEEHALAKLLAWCGLFKERGLGAVGFCLIPIST